MASSHYKFLKQSKNCKTFSAQSSCKSVMWDLFYVYATCAKTLVNPAIRIDFCCFCFNHLNVSLWVYLGISLLALSGEMLSVRLRRSCPHVRAF